MKNRVDRDKCDVSVVIPVYNEAESLRELIDRLLPALKGIGTHEVIFVDDGSSDGTSEVIDALHLEYPGIVKTIHLRHNRGKSTSLYYGFREATGELIVMIDGDLQDHPEEIPRLIKHMRDNSLDAVSGWKVVRQDTFLKRMISRTFNFVMRFFSGIDIHDFNCGLKVMRRECVERLKIYGQLHRFMLLLVHKNGFRIGELEVKHSTRKHGCSKYGNRRLYEGLMDFMTVVFISRYLQSPLYFFGFYGLFCFIIALLIGGFFLSLHLVSVFTYYPQGRLSEHPLWLLSPFIFLTGLLFVSLGLIGEMIYHLNLHHVQNQENDIRNKIGFDPKNSCCNTFSDRVSGDR